MERTKHQFVELQSNPGYVTCRNCRYSWAKGYESIAENVPCEVKQ